MLYSLLTKRHLRWEVVGFDHTSVVEARNEARTLWTGFPFLILPTRS
jgi:hypothetical protein